MSFDLKNTTSQTIKFVSIPFEQGAVFRHNCEVHNDHLVLSQSLSSRAMSFDVYMVIPLNTRRKVSIPFEQGDVFRREVARASRRNNFVSIPFEQGDVFRPTGTTIYKNSGQCLNPFRAGRCLSTYVKLQVQLLLLCLNPFRAGRCLSTAAVCWRQESCGLSDPLPNFFGRLRSWLLI